jgi:3-dehydrosphinganine reductase
MDYFRNKSVLVTGGNSGIGLATARLLRRAGANLTLVARDEAKLNSARAELNAISSAAADVRTASVDIKERDRVAEVVQGLIAERPIDVLISNAGVVMPGKFLDLPNDQFDDMMFTNFLGPVNLIRQVLPSMIERRSGHVAFVSSFAGLIGIYGYTAYSASKFAIRGFAQAFRCEMQYKPAETRAIAGNVKPVTPEYVATALLRGMAAGKFQIVPSFSARIQELAYRMMPGIAHSFFDSDVRKASGR